MLLMTFLERRKTLKRIETKLFVGRNTEECTKDSGITKPACRKVGSELGYLYTVKPRLCVIQKASKCARRSLRYFWKFRKKLCAIEVPIFFRKNFELKRKQA